MKTTLKLNTLAVVALAVAVAIGAHAACASEKHDATLRPLPPTWSAGRSDSVITDWNLGAFLIIKAGDGYVDPMAASRSLAMMHAAMHDAANAARPRFHRYALEQAPPYASKADAAVAASQAAHDVLIALYPQAAAVALAKMQLKRTLFEAGVGESIEAGVKLGKLAAAAVLAKRAADGATGKETYIEGAQPGKYRFTAPFNFAAAPHWRNVTPFVLTTPSQFRTVPPPGLTSEVYARDFNEVKRLGGKTNSQRSNDETHHASFWYEFSDIGWNRVARAASGRVRQDLWERARTFALLNMAMADAYIAGWDSKYHHNFWRPVTAIQLAGSDGNPATSSDASFEPLLVTPPVQDMPSTHSALGMAAATVLAEAFGRDQIPFSFASQSALPTNPVRSFRSFSEAAHENAESRIRAGLHFRFATDAGLELGRKIGRHANRHSLSRQQGTAARDD